MRSGNTHPCAGKLAQTQLAKRTRAFGLTPQMNCLLLAGTAPPRPHLPPLLYPQSACPWPCHFPKGIRCQGKLAAPGGKRAQADLILGAASLTRIREGVEESGPGLAAGVLPVHLCSCPALCMLWVGNRQRATGLVSPPCLTLCSQSSCVTADLPCPHSSAGPLASLVPQLPSPIRHLISGKA